MKLNIRTCKRCKRQFETEKISRDLVCDLCNKGNHWNNAKRRIKHNGNN